MMINVSNITNRTDPNSLRSRVFVGNLNTLHMQKPELESIFSKYGAIIGISVHKGFAFVQYANELHARAAVCSEDDKTYYGMKLDVTIASEPKNRKRGRSTAAQNSCTQQNLLDFALQAQALAAVGGQLSQLGIMNNSSMPISSQFSAGCLSGIGSNLNTVRSGFSQLISMRGSGQTGSYFKSGYKNIPSSLTTSSAKRTRLEASSGGSNSSLMGNSVFRSANLVPLVAPKPSSTGSNSQYPLSPESSKFHGRSTNVKGSRSMHTGGIQKLSIPELHTYRPSKIEHNYESDKKSRRQASSTIMPQRKSYTADFKLQVVACAIEKGNRAAGREFSVHEKSVREWRKEKDTLKELNPRMRARRGGKAKWPNVEENLSWDSLMKTTTAMKTAMENVDKNEILHGDDILICGQCRHLFESVDVLIVHKMAGCSITKESETCHCKLGEPASLDCAYCGESFTRAWQLVSHCHTEHGLTIYALPSRSASPSSSRDSATEDSTEHRRRCPASARQQHVPPPPPPAADSIEGTAAAASGLKPEQPRVEVSPLCSPGCGLDDEMPSQRDSSSPAEAGPRSNLQETQPIRSPTPEEAEEGAEGGGAERACEMADSCPNSSGEEKANQCLEARTSRRGIREYGRHESRPDDEDDEFGTVVDYEE